MVLTFECILASVVTAAIAETTSLRNHHQEGIGGDLRLLHMGTRHETKGEKI